jgi:pSer/pThr/pTyr-binding forkhead associated (FHA) protein
MPAQVVLLFNKQELGRYPLDKPRLVVGRDPTSDIHIDNWAISRQHCAVMAKGDAFLVQDLGSSNGTFVSGKRVAEHYLNDGDEIFLGKYILKFSNETQAKAAPQAEAGPVPETLNTYVMDGAKIQERLAKMRSEQAVAGPDAAAAPAGAGAFAATPAKELARAMDARPGEAGAGGPYKALFIISLIANVVLLLAVLMLALR